MQNTSSKVVFPAAFSDSVLQRLDSLVPAGTYLDPFVGIGGVHKLANARRTTVGIEIEEPLVEVCLARYPTRETFLGDATNLGWDDGTFDGIITSPTYGNRFADSHNAADNSHRRSYTHDMRAMTGDPTRKLHPNNSGTMHFGPKYQALHQDAWREAYRVTCPGGWMFLNVSDFIRRGKKIRVVGWHIGALRRVGWEIEERLGVVTPRMRRGQNYDARVEEERIIVARKPEG